MHMCVGRGAGAAGGISSGLTRDKSHQQLSRARRAMSAQVKAEKTGRPGGQRALGGPSSSSGQRGE